MLGYRALHMSPTVHTWFAALRYGWSGIVRRFQEDIKPLKSFTRTMCISTRTDQSPGPIFSCSWWCLVFVTWISKWQPGCYKIIIVIWEYKQLTISAQVNWRREAIISAAKNQKLPEILKIPSKKGLSDLVGRRLQTIVMHAFTFLWMSCDEEIAIF